MSPGGHLMTAVLAAGAGLVLTGSAPLAAGIVAGGFLIDVDHLADYLIVERRRELTPRSEEHTSELQSQSNLVCRLLLEKKKIKMTLSAADAVMAEYTGVSRIV